MDNRDILKLVKEHIRKKMSANGKVRSKKKLAAQRRNIKLAQAKRWKRKYPGLLPKGKR